MRNRWHKSEIDVSDMGQNRARVGAFRLENEGKDTHRLHVYHEKATTGYPRQANSSTLFGSSSISSRMVSEENNPSFLNRGLCTTITMLNRDPTAYTRYGSKQLTISDQ